MALTDTQTVRKIIQAEEILIPEVHNDLVTLELYAPAQLSRGHITSNSEVVKIIRVNAPQADSHNPITLNDQTPFNLDAQKIVPESVVVADSLILTTVYTENDDYIIDYDNGTVERTTIGSAIPNGGQVYVWNLPFVVLTPGNDYNFDYASGQINRRAGTTIPDKATVYVDFNYTGVDPADDLVAELIEEMEAYIQPRLRGGFSMESDDAGLKAAASNFVVGMYCLSASLKELKVASHDNSDDLGRRWQDLSKQYLAMAEQMFSKYLLTGSLQFGGLIQNRFVEKRHRRLQSPTLPSSIRRH